MMTLENASISFNPAVGRYTVHFAGNTYEQRVCEFLYTYSFLSNQDAEEFLFSLDSKYDYFNVPLTCAGDVITLGSVDFFAFRELYMDEMFRLKMEDMLMRNGISLSKMELCTV